MPRLLDRTGLRFGHLVVVREAGRDAQGRATWTCHCDCGAECVVASRHLGSGATSSCGCVRRITSASNGRNVGWKISGERSPFWKTGQVSYATMHGRISASRGPASQHACVDCDEKASHWSYDHFDLKELISETGQPYSMSINHYESRCVRCHSNYDNVPS